MASFCWSLAKPRCYNLGLEHRLIGKLRVSASAPCSAWQSCVCMTGDAAPACHLMSSYIFFLPKFLHLGQHLTLKPHAFKAQFSFYLALSDQLHILHSAVFLYMICTFKGVFSYFCFPLFSLKYYINPLLKKHDSIIAENIVQRTSCVLFTSWLFACLSLNLYLPLIGSWSALIPQR